MKKRRVSYILWMASLLVLSAPVQAGAEQWQRWLSAQLEQHPDMIAAQQQLLASRASADASDQPIYNPELSTELERVDDENNYRVGFQQTIDWWDKQEARSSQAVHTRAAAEAEYRQQLLEKTANAIFALVEWKAAMEAADIAKSMERQLDALLNVAQKRQQMGDLGSIDTELTFLSLSQRLAQVAETEVEVKKAEYRVKELLSDWSPERGGVPDDYWSVGSATSSEAALQRHPTIVSAKARWEMLSEETEITRRTAKADPTVGVNAGRDAQEAVLGLTFSIPLNIRNDYSAEIIAADEMVEKAKAELRAAHRKLQFDWQAADEVWKRYDQRYRRWQEDAKARVENSAELLERQWRVGDLSTSHYLQALNQRSESLLAGIELEKQTQLALTDLLLISGQLTTATLPTN